MNIKKLNTNEAFFIYIISTLLINENYQNFCILPDFSKENFNKDNLNEYFLLSYFNKYFEKEKQDLKIDFINFIKKNKLTIKKFGISNLYLFGSILKHTYHDYSDFDIVLKYDTNNISKTNNLLSNYIENKFKRKTDIHNIKDLKNNNIDIINEFYKIF